MAQKVTKEMVEALKKQPIDESKYYIPKMYMDKEDTSKQDKK